MAATISEAAAGIRDRLATINGLRVHEYIPDTINPPMAIVGLDQVDYHGSFGGGDPVYTFTVTVIVARVSERTAQTKLDAYASWSGTSSIRAAIEADKTLNGVVSTLNVPTAGNIQAIQSNEVTYLAIDFTVVVHA